MQKNLLRCTIVAFFLGTSIGTSACFAQVADFSHYHSLNDINTYLRNIANEHSDIAKVLTLGRSQQNRDVNLLILKSPTSGSTPAIYFNGTHHGNEKPSTEAVLGVLQHIIASRRSRETKDILQRYTLIFHPLVNPDGHAHLSRSDAKGKDPNRDYAYPDRDDSMSFQLPETAFVKNIFDTYDIKAAIAFHSGMEGVLWPSSYTSQSNPDQAAFSWLGQKIASAMGFSAARQSYFDYPTCGEFIDYAYMRQRTLAFTVEVSKEHMPHIAQLSAVVNKAVRGSMALIKGLIESEEVLNIARFMNKPFSYKVAH